MDPLSIAPIVAQTTAICLTTIKSLYNLREKFKDAPMVVTAICAESTVISTSLAQIQSLLLQMPNLARQWALRTELPIVLDQALTGCMLIFSCIEAEIQRITGGVQNVALKRWRSRLRMMWSESQLNDLLSSIRGQQTAMTLLIQLLQMNTLHEINDTLQRKGDAFRKSASMTQSLRARNPSVRVAGSIYSQGARAGSASAAPDALSIVAPSDLEFDFDELVINSRAYRKLVHAQANKTQTAIAGGSTSGNLTGMTAVTKAKAEAEAAAAAVESAVAPEPKAEKSPTDRRSEGELEPMTREVEEEEAPGEKVRAEISAGKPAEMEEGKKRAAETNADTLGQAITAPPVPATTPLAVQKTQGIPKIAMLSKALQKAKTAVELDDTQNLEGAIRAYAVVGAMLQQVLLRTSGEDRRKIETIHSVYMDRVMELDEQLVDIELGEKGFPQSPESESGLAP
ncbi:hypothetical protein N657DRAFT_681038 [Parathielavia appendiculata]|uniref:MIT domain-containing protein n=1 Tax=Parathielavia appendiculata TaxID=2587402 RepID=A0AAN6Z4L1_9PEZI|nr:hypothetical protein N657DRAFT_681038 [Parathielavia appendiculata]